MMTIPFSKNNLAQTQIESSHPNLYYDEYNQCDFTPLVINHSIRKRKRELSPFNKSMKRRKFCGEVVQVPSPIHPVPIIRNLVSTVSLSCSLDLADIAQRGYDCEYKSRGTTVMPAVIMRIREPRTTALVFSNGKLVCTGAKTREDSRKACRRFAFKILKLGYPVKVSDFTVRNIVGSCSVGFGIRLSVFAVAYKTHCCFEPELFPGIVYRMMEPKAVVLIFSTGNIVVTGVTREEDVFLAVKKIFPILKLVQSKKP